MKIDIGNLISVADLVASTAHGATGQRRKYTNEPYIIHPRAVALYVRELHPADLELQAAALLHDVVEDTKLTNAFIKEVFGAEIAQLVSEVTDVATSNDGNRATRMRMNRDHVALASARGQTLKACDIRHNLESILRFDSEFAPVYAKEKREQLEILTQAHPKALENAWAVLKLWEEQRVQDAIRHPTIPRGRRYGKKMASSPKTGFRSG